MVTRQLAVATGRRKICLAAIDEILLAERNVHLPQIAAPAQFVGDSGCYRLRRPDF